MSKQLYEGYTRFLNQLSTPQRDQFRELGEGQQPHTLVISCVDSRVDPMQIFDAAPGELLILRNVANIVPAPESDAVQYSSSSALEFAVTVLKVKTILVLGHSGCGGVAAALATRGAEKTEGFVGAWVSQLHALSETLECNHDQGDQGEHSEHCDHHNHSDPHAEQSAGQSAGQGKGHKQQGDSPQHALELASLRQSLANLERFDFVREAMAAGQLQLEAAWFSVPDTTLYRWDGAAFTSLAGD